jgi:hypothetical protein
MSEKLATYCCAAVYCLLPMCLCGSIFTRSFGGCACRSCAGCSPCTCSSGVHARSSPSRSPCTSGAHAGRSPCRSPCTDRLFWRPCWQKPLAAVLALATGSAGAHACTWTWAWAYSCPFPPGSLACVRTPHSDHLPASRNAAHRFFSLASCRFADSSYQIVNQWRNWSSSGGTSCAAALDLLCKKKEPAW